MSIHSAIQIIVWTCINAKRRKISNCRHCFSEQSMGSHRINQFSCGKSVYQSHTWTRIGQKRLFKSKRTIYLHFLKISSNFIQFCQDCTIIIWLRHTVSFQYAWIKIKGILSKFLGCGACSRGCNDVLMIETQLIHTENRIQTYSPQLKFVFNEMMPMLAGTME